MVTQEELLALADSMAASASELTAMSYDTLMSSRAQFIKVVAELFATINNK